LKTNQLEVYIDGASKGNPGPAGIGVVICRDSEVIKNISSYIGEHTNNVAEYTALLYALQEAMILKADSLTIHTDSELLFRQIKRLYKVRHPNIVGLYNQALHLMSAFKEVSLRHIPREQNRGADKLANLAVKRQKKTSALSKG